MSRKSSESTCAACGVSLGVCAGALPLVWAVFCGCLGALTAGFILFWMAAAVIFLIMRSGSVRQAAVKSVTAFIVYSAGLLLLLKTSVVPWIFRSLFGEEAMSPGHSFGIAVLCYPLSFIMLASEIFLSVTRAAEKPHDMEEKP